MNDQGIIIDKNKRNHTVEYISIDQKNIKTSSSVELLGVHIDDKLNFKTFKNLQIRSKPTSCSNKASDVSKLRRKEDVNYQLLLLKF